MLKCQNYLFSFGFWALFDIWALPFVIIWDS